MKTSSASTSSSNRLIFAFFAMLVGSCAAQVAAENELGGEVEDGERGDSARCDIFSLSELEKGEITRDPAKGSLQFTTRCGGDAGFADLARATVHAPASSQYTLRLEHCDSAGKCADLVRLDDAREFVEVRARWNSRLRGYEVELVGQRDGNEIMSRWISRIPHQTLRGRWALILARKNLAVPFTIESVTAGVVPQLEHPEPWGCSTEECRSNEICAGDNQWGAGKCITRCQNSNASGECAVWTPARTK